jgi:hypothetical protein
MSGGYEAEGMLEGDRVIRLKDPLPCKDQPVKVIVTPQTEMANLRERNRMALAALDRLLAEPDDMTTEQWMELEKVIEEHPLRIRKDVAS